MNSVLALGYRERAELFSATARKLGFSNEAIAEKDFWVCWALGQLFQGIPGIGEHLVFKGGTSLSKVYRAINRFSEDVDITVGRELLGFDSDEHDPEKAANKSQAKKKTEQLVAACGRWVAGDLKTQLESRTRDAIGSGPWKYSVDDTDQLTLLCCRSLSPHHRHLCAGPSVGRRTDILGKGDHPSRRGPPSQGEAFHQKLLETLRGHSRPRRSRRR